MVIVAIDYENDLLKHYVRMNGWLPACRKRRDAIRAKGGPRRLRYFTFCARYAMDVLMLDVAKILTRSESDKFDSVVFFDRDRESVLATKKRIPGAIPFTGNFVQLMLREDPEEDAVLEEAPLDAPEDKLDEASVRETQREMDERREFMKQFPFDVVNLDLEEFAFKPKEELPGKVVQAFRKLCAWQTKPLYSRKGKPSYLEGFSLMFTTQIGPSGMSAPFKEMLSAYLRSNVQGDKDLMPLLANRASTDDIDAIRDNNFDLFFKLGMPKVLVQALLSEDWYVESAGGVQIFQFERPSKDGPYQMLHLIMDVVRQQPHKDKRPPNNPATTDEASQAYREVARRLFQESEIMVKEDSMTEDVKREIRASLAKIDARAKKYMDAAF
jgi:hypothetical protein